MTSAVAGLIASRPRRLATGPFVQAAATPPTPPPVDLTDPYATIVLGVGAGPVRFWRFDDVSATEFRCSITGANGTYPLSPAAFDVPQLPTTTTGGGCVNMGGAGYAQSAYDAVEATAAAEGFISGWVNLTAAAIAAEAWLVAKGNVANDVAGRGRLLVRVFADGRIRAFWRNGVASSVELTIAGAIAADTNTPIACAWSPSGVRLIVNGVLEATSSAHTIGLANNTEPWQFGVRNNVTPFVAADAKFDEFPLYAGPVTSEELQALADYVPPASSDDVGLAPAALYQPFAESGADTVEVGSILELQTAINAAPPGRNILLAPGAYTGSTFTFNPQGAAGNPIVIRPRDGYGTVTINAPDWTITGSHFVLSKLQFTNPLIKASGGGQFGRITRCKISSINRESIEQFNFKNFRVDRCDVSGYQNTTAQKGFVKVDRASIVNGTLRNQLVDRNWIHDTTPTTGVNGSSVLGLEGATGSSSVFPGVWIERNLFDNINLSGESELIGTKTGGMVCWRNTFINAPAQQLYLHCPRLSEAFELLECWFENNNRARVVQLLSRNSKAIGNRFVGTQRLVIGSGDFYWTGELPGGYPAAESCQIVGNQVGANGYIEVGASIFGTAPPLAARNCNLWANTSDVGGTAHTLINATGTTLTNPGISYTPAVKLTTADVGPLAP